MSQEVLHWPREELSGRNEEMERAQKLRIRRMVEQGISISQVARVEGIDRKTVYRAVESLQQELPDHVPRISLLSPYEAQLKEWTHKGLSAAWMYQELTRKYQYTGSYDTVKRFVAAVRPPKPADSVIRFETAPGDQAQMDWAHFQWMDDKGKRHRLYAFVFTLGYSRWMKIYWVEHSDIKTIIRCHEQAFEELGGVPAEVLYDRQSPVYQRQQGKEIRLNPVFEQFARHWGFEPVLAQARRAQTKGKVERPIRYIRGNFFVSFTEPVPAETIQRESDLWLDTWANVRIHRTTQERPVDRLAADRAALLPLAATRFAGDFSEIRQVPPDFHINWGGTRYSVPHTLVGQTVRVREAHGQVCIWSGDTEVARHPVGSKGARITKPAHEEGVRRPRRETTLGIQQKFLAAFPDCQAFVEGIRRYQTGNVSYHLREILALQELYSEAVVHKAVQKAQKERNFHCRWVRNLCKTGEIDGPERMTTLPGGKKDHPKVEAAVETRPLEIYERIARTQGGGGT